MNLPNLKKAKAGLLVTVASGLNQQKAEAASPIGSPANGSCYRLDRWQNSYSGECDFPNNRGYSNLRKVTKNPNGIPAVINFVDPTNYFRSHGTCVLGSDLYYFGYQECYNPKPYIPTIVRIKPVYNNSTTYFMVHPN
jgi:hypothetical protein